MLNKADRPHRSKSLYSTVEWRRIRAHQLHIEPYCRMCAAEGVQTRATVADHVERHNYDPQAFFFGPLQSLCKRHHDSTKQRAETLGYDPSAIGSDGLPTDPNHPFNKG